MIWLQELKVGDEVAFGNCRQGRPSYSFSKVVSISAKGQIKLENGKRFTKDGVEIGTGSAYFKDDLWDATKARERIESYRIEKEKREAQRNLQQELTAFIASADLEQLKQMHKLVEELKQNHSLAS